jgi:hypothetical protein
MGSPTSTTIAEIYLQYFENIYIKHWLDSKEMVFYKRYVDDIMILYDQQRTDKHKILQQINEIDKHLQFKISTEVNNTINYLDILIHRNNDAITIEIYRKPTEKSTIIHLISNHPFENKIPAFLYYINRLTTLPITEKSKQKEWGTILTIAKNNGYPPALIHRLKSKLKNTKRAHKQNCTQQQQATTTLRNKWVTFTYSSPLIRKISNLFRQTNLKIAFCATNTIQQQ